MDNLVTAVIVKLTNDFWLTTIFSFVSSAIGIYVGGYLLKKAGHLATKEDFSDFRQQLQITTKDAEEIKQQLSRHTWINQQQWSARELCYGELLTKLHNLRVALQGLSNYYIEPGSEYAPDHQQGEHFQRLKEDAGKAVYEIRKLLGPAALYLSRTTVEKLSEMLSKHWELIEFEASCTAEYAEQAQVLADSSYDLVLVEAKQHLAIC